MENKKFTLETLSSLPTFKERREYCDNVPLPVIGHGGSRIIYKISKDLVLKLAYIPSGITQNELECDSMNQQLYSEVLTKIYNHDKNYKWLITEYAKPINEKTFLDIVGVSFKTWVAFMQHKRISSDDNFTITEQSIFTQTVIEIYEGMFPSDLFKLNSYGLVGGKIKLVDYGGI